MKRGVRYLDHRKGLIAAYLLAIACALPVWRAIPQLTSSELEIMRFGHVSLGILGMRGVIMALVLGNITLAYLVIRQWFGQRFASMSAFVLTCLPIWLIMQLTAPRLTALTTLTLIAFLMFDKAGRSEEPTIWYSLTGLTSTGAWLLEPVGTTLLMMIGALLLVAVKPRYSKHIARQASLIAIILIVSVGALTAASLKLHLGVDHYLAGKLQATIHFGLASLISGPSSYRFGLPGVSLIPLAMTLMAGLGAWELITQRKRPRNLFMVTFTVLCGIFGLLLSGMTALLLISVSFIGGAVLTSRGIMALHRIWHSLFPKNHAAAILARIMIVILLASLATYSYWYVVRAWKGNPQSRIDVPLPWNGIL